MDQPKAQTPEQRKAALLLASCVIFLVALNLRPAIVAVGPLLSSIGTTFGWGESLQGLLGSLPLLAFALFSMIVGALTAKLDSNKVLLWALIALAGGCIVRSLSSESMVWLGTLVIGASIAVGNVLAPAIVKRDFIDNVSFATGAYSACVTAGSALAGLTASAAADALGGWQPALAFWAIPALLAAFLWLLRTKLARDIESNQAGEKNSAGKTHLERMPKSTKTIRPIRENAQAKSPLRALLKRPSTWLVTLFMGLQSAAFYTFCNWLPSIAGAAGFSSGEAGVHLFIFQALGIVSGLLIPRFMYLRGNQVRAGLLASAPLLVAALGWLLNPHPSLLWSIFGGIGQGASLVVALTLISLRGRTHAETVALSGFAQSLGYLLAACGPFVFGALTETTQGFEAPLVFMAALATAQCALSFFCGTNSQRSVTSTRFFAAKHRICRTARDQLISYRANQGTCTIDPRRP